MVPTEFYGSRISQYADQLKKIKQRSTLISLTRLGSFLLLCILAYFYFNNQQPVLLILLITSIVVFVTLVRVSASLSAKKNLVAQLLFLNENEMGILNGKDNSFDDGSSITHLAMHAADLDIFGKRSIFHLLNRTTTSHGRNALAFLLNNPLVTIHEIKEQQKAIQKLAAQKDIRQLITAQGLLQEKESGNVEEIVDWIETSDKMITNPWLNPLRFIMPLIIIGGILLYLSNGNPIMFGAGIIINWFLIGKYTRYTLRQHLLIGRKDDLLEQYGTILKAFEKAETADSAELNRLKNISASAMHEILKLSKLSSLFDQRLNLLVGIFLNWFFLYDIHVMLALENWKKKNRSYFREWIKAVGEIEMLNSLASFSFNYPQFVLPELLDKKPFIRAIAIGHPLIPEKVQVTNDIIAGEQEQLLLITGSNMSGKSTFLRTIGVNVLLAQCGLPVCATEFSFSPMHILSSIRITDSLQENTSYFMAELKRLKEIIDFLSTGKPALVLIDEVLRGTNSEDKKYGSEELIKRLSDYNCLAFFASHDLSLSTLETTLPGKVRNYCFESTIINGELLFDYKLHRGVATNKNASFLMQKMGIISTNSRS